MKIMLGMLVNLLESLDQIVNTDAKAVIGTLKDLFIKLGGQEGDSWLEMLKKFLRQEPCWVTTVKTKTAEVANKLLELVITLNVSAVERFVATDHFVAGQTVDGVKYSSSFGSNFNTHFLPKVELGLPATDLRVHRLLRKSKDLGIRTEIGEAREETNLAHIHELLKLQGNRQEGVLLTNGWTNIFYVRDIHGILWAVYVRWCGDGWCLGADSVEHPYDWVADRQVFSR